LDTDELDKKIVAAAYWLFVGNTSVGGNDDFV